MMKLKIYWRIHGGGKKLVVAGPEELADALEEERE